MNDEDALLATIQLTPNDDTAKLVYADWLDEHDRHNEANFIRLNVKLDQETETPPELKAEIDVLAIELAQLRNKFRAGLKAVVHSEQYTWKATEAYKTQETRRNILTDQLRPLHKQLWDIKFKDSPTRDMLQKLAADLDPKWLAIVSNFPLEGCGNANRGAWRLSFEVICPMTWKDMTPTENTKVRHCSQCDQTVHYCDNLAEAREHANKGNCIGIDLGIKKPKDHLQGNYARFGRPSIDSQRENWQTNLDEVSIQRLKKAKKYIKNNKATQALNRRKRS